ncbi:MAG: HTTM domain-containing protein [Taibaiella sp.]|nr:HTTM domain-containing protein [Taibaiella sp.]
MTVTKNNGPGRAGGFAAIFSGGPVSIAPLVTFRIVFGLLMFFSIARFWLRGWITSVYVDPPFHFTYMGFDWVHPMGSFGMHALFALLGLSALFVTFGFLYRLSITFFFLAFTYVELLDVTTYLNHYYFISLVSFIMIWLPANAAYSSDVRLRPSITRSLVPAWTINLLRFQMACVYFFAGVAKLNPDWMLHAIPMRIWLPAKTHLPIVGPMMYETWVAYLFSWFGAFYDLFIAFFLIYPRTRKFAYLFVIIFHTATAIFFPMIGVFPYVMMTCSLIFFSASFHEKLLSYLPGYSPVASPAPYTYLHPTALRYAVYIFIAIQLLLPFRYVLYPGKLFWHEQGFRFSWRVMLMEKSGSTYFTIRDTASGKSYEVNNREFLTPIQEKMMSTQPDLILRYAHYLAARYRERGVENPGVYGEVYVALNGQRSQLFIDTTVNLAAQPLGWNHYSWVLPYKEQ